jgi:hypothetical protein
MKRVSIAIAVTALAGLTAGLASGAGTKAQELYAELSGASEVPAGAENGKGEVELTLDPGNGRVCWRFSGLTGLEGKPLLSHIHKGPAGKAGDVVVPLGKTFKARGCTKAKTSLVRSILAKPGRYYVNVHNDKYPAGAVRGQLERQES